MVRTGLPSLLWFWDMQAKQEMFYLCVVWLTMFITKTFILFRMEVKAKTKWFFVISSMVTRGNHSDEVTSVVFFVAKPRQLPWWVPGGTRKKAIERCQLRNGWCTNGDTRQETDIQIVHLLQHQILRMLTTYEQQNFHWQSSNINKNHTCRFIITAQGEHRVN